MKKAFGILELLIVLVVIVILTLMLGKGGGRNNPFDEIKEVKSKQQMVDEKLEQINRTKQLKEQIEKNLQQNY